MIGYYVHHQGRGHLHRAVAIADELSTVVTGLSSLPRPAGWRGPWIELPRDDEGATRIDVTARDRLHWVPELDRGLAARMAEIGSWIDDVEPLLLVVDVSVEVSLLARLHGVPVVTMVLPGDRRDPAHDLVHAVARRVVAVWPDDVDGMVHGPAADRFARVGAVSRYDREVVTPRQDGDGNRVLVLNGAGGSGIDDDHLAKAREDTPDWTWRVLGPGADWVDDVWSEICAADVVVTHAGQNALAEVAAARRPAVVVPQDRPFDEQRTTARALEADGRFPVMVVPSFPPSGWSALLQEAQGLDGGGWAAWNDGRGARRAAQVIETEMHQHGRRTS